MKTFVWTLLIAFSATALAVFGLLGAWVWTGDGRYGLLAGISLIAAVVLLVLVAGFMGVDEAQQKKDRSVFKG